MKKIILGVSVLLVASCSIGHVFSGMWEAKEDFTQGLASYSISFYDNEPQLIRSESFTEKNNRTNQVLTAYKGQNVIFSKSYVKEFYASESVRINQAGTLGGSAAPVVFKKNDTRPVMGTTSVEGETFYLIPSDLEKYVFLVRDNGTFYNKMGRLKNGRVALMETIYVPYPDDLRFEAVMTATTEQTKPIDGFEIRYDGIKRGLMQFTYMTFDGSGSAGSFETVEYPVRQGTITIHGNKINVIKAGADKLDYTLVD